MDRDEVTRELLQLADQTKNLTKALRRFGRQRADHFKKYDPIRDAITYEVWEAVDEDGKRKYPNEKREDAYNQERDITDELDHLQDRKRILLVSLGAPLPADVLEAI